MMTVFQQELMVIKMVRKVKLLFLIESLSNLDLCNLAKKYFRGTSYNKIMNCWSENALWTYSGLLGPRTGHGAIVLIYKYFVQ